MSEIKVNSIKGVGASAAAITVNNTDGTCTANITNNLSNRNLVINGAMQVAQRGTSSTSSGFQTVDRFEVEYSGTDEAPTQAQVDVSAGTTPYTNGFRKAFEFPGIVFVTLVQVSADKEPVSKEYSCCEPSMVKNAP